MKAVIAFSNKTEGRDKFCKAVQYGCRMLKAMVQNPEAEKRLNALFAVARDSRKVFRMGKSIHEVQTILDTVVNMNMDATSIGLQILARISYLAYWIFDNLQLLASIQVIKRDAKWLGKNGMKAWLLGIIFSLILLIRKLQINYTTETKKKATITNPQILNQALDTLKQERFVTTLNLVKNIGDFLPAANGAGLPQAVLGKTFHEKWIGLGGLISALISCYQAWG